LFWISWDGWGHFNTLLHSSSEIARVDSL
jgi:hypothetical protein